MKTVPLKDVCQISMGQAPDGSSYNDLGEGFPLIAGAGDFGPLSPKPKKFTTEPTRVSEVDDVILCIRATIGDLNWSDKAYCLGRGVAGLRPDGNKLDKHYLWHWLTSQKDFLFSQGTGSTFKQISRSTIDDLQIPLPPLPEQKRIAAILDKADAIRRKRQQAVKLTEELLRSVFLDMFGDPVTNPKGWPQAPIKEFGMVMTGNTPSREKPEYYGEKIEWIKSDNINTPYHYLTEARERLSEEGQKVGRIVPAGSILVTCIAGSPECIGNVALSNRDVAFNQQINAISPFEGIDSFFLYSQILVAKKLIQGESTESMKGMVNKGKFENILLIKPPIELQKKYCGIFKKLEVLSHKNDKAFNNSATLFTSLLQRAFRGEL